MMYLDIDKHRLYTAKFNNFDINLLNREYDFYYDETNNARKFKLNPDGFNVDEGPFFILGGLVFNKNKSPNKNDLDVLFSKLNLQKNMSEIKFKHIKKEGDNTFIDLLNSSRFETIINWIYKNNYWIHYSYRDNFFYSIVDIIDSMEESYILGPDYLRLLKCTLYEHICKDPEIFKNILIESNYPNINREIFIDKIISWIDSQNINNSNELTYIKKSLINHRHSELSFIENNEDHILISNYSDIYMNRLITFLHSQHLLDEEKEIQKILDMIKLYDQTHNYKFEQSNSNRLLQLSDIIVGSLSLFFNTINSNNTSELKFTILNLTTEKKELLKKFQTILNNSLAENEVFKHGSADNIFEQKFNTFLDIKII